jgi:hypothetical protein
MSVEEIVEKLDRLNDLAPKALMGCGLGLVGAENQPFFIAGSDAQKLAKLQRAIDEGATPVCFLGLQRTGLRLEILAEPVTPELLGSSSMDVLLESFRIGLEKAMICRPSRVQ